MIDLGLLRTHREKTIKRIQEKDPSFNGNRLADLDIQCKEVRQSIEMLRSKRNELAKQGKGGVTEELRQQSIALSGELKAQEKLLEEIDTEFRNLYLSCPNLPEANVPVGGKECNEVVKVVGEKPTFDFSVKNHVELGEALGWLDFTAAARIAGSNFALYRGDAVKLLYSLTQMMLKHNIKHGFEPVLPPYLVNKKSLTVASNFPKFRDQVYAIPEDDLFLTPTAEVDLANLYRDNIFQSNELPKRMTSWTSCFRREAGGYGATERGLIRIHQFEKVELFTICDPDKSNEELDKMIACAEGILQKLGLHYRISLLATQDCSFPSAKTYDIEVWLPGQKEYYEVSSCSNCTDFQARRGMIRYRDTPESKTQLVNTLNASSLALPRLMVAIMETYQQEDGSIALPKVITDYLLFQ